MVKTLDRVHQVSDAMLRRYRIMRLLYNGSLTFDELQAQMPDIEPRGIITALGILLNNHDIKKEKIPPSPPADITDVTIAKELLGVKEKPKYKYQLLDRGRKKLAYLEWKFQLYTKVPSNAFPWGDGYNQQYYEEITEHIKKQGWPTG